MRAFISTSDRRRRSSIIAAGILLASLGCPPWNAALAQQEDAAAMAEEGDLQETPYTEYGDFHDREEEAEDARFFQYGRFFGVSLGGGVHGATGNRGLLWQGGFPLVDFKVHAWFDFNVALAMGFHTASHFYDKSGNNDIVNVTFLNIGLYVKYYIPTGDLTAAITFAHPYLILGGGSFNKTESDPEAESVTPDNSFGFGGGAGLEFALSPRKTYLTMEAKIYSVTFEDEFTGNFLSLGIPDLTGAFYSLSASLLFTW